MSKFGIKFGVLIALLVFLSLTAVIHAFIINSYDNQVTVLENGSINVYEKIDITLEKQFNEGFRTIRKLDFDTLSDIHINSVRLNGEGVEYKVQTSPDSSDAEIDWEKTVAGSNIVELNYTIANRVYLYNDFARLCYEHFGANWPTDVKSVTTKTTLPISNRGKTINFEIYSATRGSANLDDTSIATSTQNVPSGNYIGGCYLFDRNSVNSSKTVNASAYDILKNERELYGSDPLLVPEAPVSYELCFVPLAIFLFIVLIWLYNKKKPRHKYPEQILPPEKEEAVVVEALLTNDYDEKNTLAATILGLINKGIVDILELEKTNEAKTGQINRDRTILFLKKKNANLKDYEQAVVDMIFYESNEVDLDALADKFNKVRNQEDAKKIPTESNMKKFTDAQKQILSDNNMTSLSKAENGRNAISGIVGFFLLFGGCFLCIMGFDLMDAINYHLAHGNTLIAIILPVSLTLIIISLILIIYFSTKREAPKQFEDKYEKWDSFERAVRATHISADPPSSALIWGEILVYATAIGIADKVNRHLSELKSFEQLKKVEQMTSVTRSTYLFYGASLGLRNLSQYGSRAGPKSSGGYGGFSSGSSGGWSSGGGGGFSGGSSGGGGFR